MSTRSQMWERLGDDVDVLVVGGGITGAGVARDAARRGLRVALVDMGDLASGTSSRSSKLVHGGLRYLETYELALVFESVSERRTLLDLAPHLVNPLAFLFPVYAGSRRNLWTINAGMWVYEGLSLFRSPKKPRRLKRSDVEREEPGLLLDGLKGAPLYYDCSTDDARLTLETALDAEAHGAIITTWACISSFLKDDAGRVSGAVVRDVLGGGHKEVRAAAVINATGPWTDHTLHMDGRQGPELLRPTKGVHVVVDAKRLAPRHAVVAFHPDDDRVLFVLPWGERTYIGTTDTDYEGDPAEVAATREDVDYLLAAANAHFPRAKLGHDDVVSTWAGLRPLIAPGGGANDVAESKVSREHQIVIGNDGLLTVAGGKLTTYRRMAAEAVDSAVQLLKLSGHLSTDLRDARTDSEPLPGAVGWPVDDDHAEVARRVERVGAGTLSSEVARHLGDTYGMRALAIAERCADDASLAAPLVEGRPEILAQVDWGIDEELAATVSDILIRRTQLFYRA